MEHRMVLVAVLATITACGRAGESGDAPPRSETGAAGRAAGAPQVAAEYQGAIDRAWKAAVEGTNPAFSCAALQGRLSRVYREGDPQAKDDARGAAEACSVLVGAQYFLTFLDEIENGKKSCQDLIMASAMIPALLLTLESESEAEQQARRARLVGTIEPRLAEVCPAMAGVL